MSIWLPRKFIFALITVLLVNLAVIKGYAAPRHDPEFTAYYPLLAWRDPVNGTPLHLQIDRSKTPDEQIAQLQQVVVLNLNGNHLTELPPQIGNLKSLYRLHLAGNQLQELPPEIGNLNHLLFLDLGNNRLRTLPPQIGNMTRLQLLNLNFNQLRQLPPELRNVSTLEQLYFGGNEPLESQSEIEELCSRIACEDW
ncbi:MAG: leucine-rich repeat domain-containing protein [Chloroflexi bacterium]|nr:leucine-rich repeat domain-containing protein [Chloroflexota bacterium]